MPIGLPLPTAELQLVPTTGTSWSTASHSQMQVGIARLPKREDIRYCRCLFVTGRQPGQQGVVGELDEALPVTGEGDAPVVSMTVTQRSGRRKSG